MVLKFETIKFTILQLKSNTSIVYFSKLIPPNDQQTFNEDFWNYWVFDTYQEVVNWVTSNMPEQLENIPPEEMM